MMKKLTYILLSLLIFWSCASTPEESTVVEVEPAEEAPVEDESEAVAQAVEKPAAEKPPAPVLMDIQVPHPVKETRFFRDGSVDTWIEYTYLEGTGLVTGQNHFDQTGTLTSNFVFENKDGMAMRRDEFSADGALSGYETYEYDSNGNMTRKIAFDSKGNPQLVSESQWNAEGKETKLIIYDGSSALLSYIEYIYNDGLLILSELFGADGMKTNYFQREYNDGRLLTAETDYSADGEIEGRVEYTYEEGFLSLEEHKNRGGGVVRRFIYENDENGSPVKIFLENNRGIVLETVEKSYFYTTEQIVVE